MKRFKRSLKFKEKECLFNILKLKMQLRNICYRLLIIMKKKL